MHLWNIETKFEFRLVIFVCQVLEETIDDEFNGSNKGTIFYPIKVTPIQIKMGLWCSKLVHKIGP